MTTPTPTPTRVARPKGVRDVLLDMARSLGLMAILVAALLFLTPARGLIFPDPKDRMPVASYTDVVQGFAQVVHRPALVPYGLPASWRANAATFAQPSPTTASVHIGWAVDASRYAGLDETSADPNTLIGNVLGPRGMTVTGTVTIDGAVWQTRTSSRGERAYTRVINGTAVVVTGNASDAQLRLLCALLRPYAG